MSRFSHGYHCQRYCSWARAHDDGDDDDGVAQHGGHALSRDSLVRVFPNFASATCNYFVF